MRSQHTWSVTSRQRRPAVRYGQDEYVDTVMVQEHVAYSVCQVDSLKKENLRCQNSFDMLDDDPEYTTCQIKWE